MYILLTHLLFYILTKMLHFVSLHTVFPYNARSPFLSSSEVFELFQSYNLNSYETDRDGRNFFLSSILHRIPHLKALPFFPQLTRNLASFSTVPCVFLYPNIFLSQQFGLAEILPICLSKIKNLFLNNHHFFQ